jgi:hypothetical protein
MNACRCVSIPRPQSRKASALVEKVSGRTLADFMNERLLRPLGLLVQHPPYDEHKIFWRFSTPFYRAIAD